MSDLLDAKQLKLKSDMLKAIAHPIRLCILNCLVHESRCNVTELASRMNTPQSTISQHLTKLRSQGLIEGDRHGVEIQYRIISEEIRPLIALLLNEIESDPSTGITLNC